MLTLLPDGKQRAYTSILSVMQVMEKKGLIDHEKKGTANIYYSLVSQGKVLGPFLRSLVANVFGGSSRTAIQHLLEENEVNDRELEEIRQVIDTYGKAKPDGEEVSR